MGQNKSVSRSTHASTQAPQPSAPVDPAAAEFVRDLEQARALKDQERRFIERRRTAANALGACRFPYFGDITREQYDNADDLERDIPWFKDDVQFCTYWVDAWLAAIAALTAFGLSADRVAELYDPLVHDTHAPGQRKELTKLVRAAFLKLMRAPKDKQVRRDVLRTVVHIRVGLAEDRHNIEHYFDLIPRKVNEIQFTPPPRSDPRTLFEASDHWIRHRDLANALGASGKGWYLKWREHPERATSTSHTDSTAKNSARVYRIGDLLAEWRALASVTFPDQDIGEALRTKLRTDAGVRLAAAASPKARKVRHPIPSVPHQVPGIPLQARSNSRPEK